jgi:pimeloyl-ACP methyl ester carboxylesterase
VQIGSRYLETAWWGPPPTEAATLVLLHEGLGCVALWRDVPERLAEATGCGVFAYSRFGYGQSDPQPLPWKLTYMQDEARDIVPRVLDEARIRDAMLVGHSDGGSIAAVYAGATRDQRLRGVVLMAAHFFVEDSNVATIAKIRADYRQGPLRERLARYHRDPDMAFHGWCDSWLDPGFRRFDITGCIPQIDVPILGLQGAQDPYGSNEQLLTLQRLARSACEIAFIKGARHSPHLEAKDDTIGRIAQFARHLPSRGPGGLAMTAESVRT